MYKCPECNDQMIWQSDHMESDMDYDLIGEDYTISFYHCSDCDIELIKRVKVQGEII